MECKTIVALALSFVCATSAFAGKEDWNGAYKVQVSETEIWDVIHTPTRTKVLFFSTGGCTHFGKGANLNGVMIKDDIDICVAENVPNFTNEVQKLGTIVSKKITLGPTYSETN
ncbi:MAG: hypothetical protein P4L65_03545 [Legionella sp.]|nr:hypothetical protein [Legionella sp.]